MPLSDSSKTCTRAVWHSPSPAGLLASFPTDISEVSRFSCMKFLGVSGVFDYAGLTGGSRCASGHIAFRQIQSVGVLIAIFRSSIPSPPIVGIELGRASSQPRFPRPPYNSGRPDFPGPV